MNIKKQKHILITILSCLVFAWLGCSTHPAESISTSHSALEECTTIRRGTDGSAEDATIFQSYPNYNTGSDALLTVGTGSSGYSNAVIRFDVSTIPQNAQITSASIVLTASSATQSTIGIHEIAVSWSETSVVWNTIGSAYGETLESETISGWDIPITISLPTSIIDGWRTMNHGVLLEQVSGKTTIRSSERATISQRPTLYVCWNTETGTGGETGQGGSGIGGNQSIGGASEGGASNGGSGLGGEIAQGGSGVGGATIGTNAVGYDGIALFNALSPADINAIKTIRVFFQHKSVGASIIGTDPRGGGTEALLGGTRFLWTETATAYTTRTLGERIFDASSSNPLGEIAEFRRRLVNDGIANVIQVATMKFCFTGLTTDTPSETESAMRTAYTEMVAAAKSMNPNLKFVHIGPPLARADGYAAEASNARRLTFTAWLISTFPDDTVFDLEDVESRHADGSPCTLGSARVLCPEFANDAAGHLNPEGATRAAKGFLYALRQAVSGG